MTYSTAGSSSLTVTPLEIDHPSQDPPESDRQESEAAHLDCFEGVKASLEPIACHRSSDVGTTYIGLAEDNLQHPKFELQQEFSFDPQSYAKGFLPNGKDFKILIDTGATSSYFSKEFYDNNPDLHSLPKYKSRGGRIYMGNGEWVPCLFVIPLTFRIDNQAFEIFTIVCKMANSDFVWGMKEIIETEGILCTRSMKYKFLNRSPKLYPLSSFSLPADNSQRTIELRVDFPHEISGHAILKLLLVPGQVLFTVKAPVNRNKIVLEISNNTDSKITGSPKQSVGILDARSVGYFHVGLDHIKKTFLRNYHFKTLNELSLQFNKMINEVNDSTRLHRPLHPKKHRPQDPYPWLEPDDPRRNLTDEQILDRTIDLSTSCLTNREKCNLMRMIKRYKRAFSLRDEIGECPNIQLNIDVIDDSPFFVRPFPIAEKDKPIMDRQMNRLVSLGILSPNNTSHTSPVMLITRKVTQDKRPVVDFRLLNTRIRRRNTASPLMRDICNILGKSGCEVMSCVDIKDAFHSIRLNERSKEFCGILPYFGSTHYRYEVLPMGLAISPAAWLMYVNILLDTFGPHKKSFIAIMDDLLIHSSVEDHFQLIEMLLKGLCKHGLKLSPKKSQLFRRELVYMGNVFSIKDQRMTIEPIRTRIDAINSFPRPRSVRECKSFCGVVNYLSFFCKDLQKLLSPIYHLTKKDVPFRWTDIQEQNFEEIKKRLCSSPVLALPTAEGRYILYSDTSRTHTESALWQIQEGVPRLIGYASKTLPSACRNYSVTELEMTGMLINLHTWRGFTDKAEIDVAVDHKAVVQIMKAKHPPVTTRVETLLEKMLAAPFNLYYVKGKDLILADFLSRIHSDRSDPNEVIPISFVDMAARHKHLVLTFNGRVTRSSTKKAGLEMPPIHGSDKPLDPHRKPEHQPTLQPQPKRILDIAPPPEVQKPNKRLITPPSATQVASRKLIDRSVKILRGKKDQNNPTSTSVPLKLPQMDPLTPKAPTPPLFTAPEVEESLDFDPRDLHLPPPPPQVDPISKPPCSEPAANMRLPPKPLDTTIDVGQPIPNYHDLADIEVRRPLPDELEPPLPLSRFVDTSKIARRRLPQQSELDPLLKEIQTKILRQVHLPTSFRDLRGAYLNSAFFRDIYLHLSENKSPSNPRKRAQILSQASDYMLLDTLLFKVIRDRVTQDHKLLLCIPASKINTLLHYFHTSLMGGHMGMTKTYMTIGQRFFCPNLAHHIRAYLIGCHVCQMVKAGKPIKRPFQKRINVNTPALSRVSMDIKHMPLDRSPYKYQYILVMLCEVSNFMVAIPLRAAQTREICTGINKHFIRNYGPPTHLICDQATSFLSSLAQAFFSHYGIRLIMVSPY